MRLRLWFLSAAFLVAACGGSEDQPSGSVASASTPVPRATLLDELTRVLCDRQARCGCTMVERADCETQVRQRFSTTLAQLESSRPRYDGVCARAALDRVSQAACSERVDTIVPYETQVQCGGGCRVFDVEDTSSCNNTGLCPQGFVCAYGASYSCVPCQVPGDLCIYGSCGALLLCNQNTNRCEEPPDVGAPCPRGLCKSGACVSGTCTPLLALGKACNSSSQCQSGYCPRGACDTLPGLGAPCPANRCDAGLRCDTAQQPEPEPRCVTDTVTACQLPYNF